MDLAEQYLNVLGRRSEAQARGDAEAVEVFDQLAGTLREQHDRSEAMARLNLGGAGRARDPRGVGRFVEAGKYGLADLLAASDTPRGRRQVSQAWREHNQGREREERELRELDKLGA